jgi:hypothetical protein
MPKIEIKAIFCFFFIFMLEILAAGKITSNKSEKPLMIPVVEIPSLPKPSCGTVPVS